MKSESVKMVLALVTIVILIIGFVMVVLPLYGVWAAEQHGRAELANAEYSKRVAVETAKARRDSASFEAEAEVARAQGVAQSNHIIGDSLKGKEEYLRYLYITNLSEGENREVIYIPTEAGIPILEANRLRTIEP